MMDVGFVLDFCWVAKTLDVKAYQPKPMGPISTLNKSNTPCLTCHWLFQTVSL